MGEVIRAISEDGFVSISVINSKDIAERARNIHGTTPVATAALGRALSATSIMGSVLKKEGASVTVRFDGGGPIGTILTVSDNEGDVRGFVSNPLVDLPKNAKGKLDVGGAVGNDGTLSVVRDFGEGEPYTSTSALVSGEIAEDFATYFASSEQVPTVCAFGVLIDRDRSVLAAGGYILQLLPGAPESVIDALEHKIENSVAVTDILKDNDIDAFLNIIMDGFNPRILERSSVEYKCTCNRDRFLRVILSLGEEELSDMREQGEPIEVPCRFCDEVYVFDVGELVFGG